MKTYLALLRGINVGGRNVIRMADLTKCFEESGFDRVATFIQSGNVLFNTSDRDPQHVASRIEAAIAQRFRCESKAVVLSYRQLKSVVDCAPAGFGNDPGRFRYDVTFLRPPLEAADLMRLIPTREGVDRAYAGQGVLYFSRVIARAAQSRLSKIVSLPIYKELTIRNWNTTTALLQLMTPARQPR
jgi:uncharacterized protein (DUF1697 family)